MSDQESKKDLLIKVRIRRDAILRLIYEDDSGAECSTRAIAERLKAERIITDKSTIWRDYSDESFKTEIREMLLSKHNTSTLIRATANVAGAINKGDVPVSEKMLDRTGFYPPPELVVRGRIEAPGDARVNALIDAVEAEGGTQELAFKIIELLEKPDEEPEQEPEPEPKS